MSADSVRVNKPKGPTAAQIKYWEEKLLRYRLGMDRGASDFIEYGHAVLDLDFDGRIAYRPKENKTPTGESLENEWPQSMC